MTAMYVAAAAALTIATCAAAATAEQLRPLCLMHLQIWLCLMSIDSMIGMCVHWYRQASFVDGAGFCMDQ